MNSDLFKYLKEDTEMELLLRTQDIPVMSFYQRGNSSVVDKDLVIPQGHLIGIHRQPRHVPVPSHSHNYVEFVYMYSGSTKHIIDSRTEITLNPHDLLMIRQGTVHSVEPAGTDDIAVNFLILPEFFRHPDLCLEDGSVLRHFIVGSSKKNGSVADYLHYHLEGLPPAQNLLENMIWSLLHQSMDRQSILQSTLGVLLQELLITSTQTKLSDTSRYEAHIMLSACHYIEKQYPTATLEEFSASVTQPSYYVSRLFKKHTGNTFKEYVQSVRLARAAYLLTYTAKPVEKIIAEIGYENSSYFHKIFKKAYHMTPKQYRNFCCKGTSRAEIGSIGTD